MSTPKKMTRREFMAAAGGSVVAIRLPGTFVKIMDSEHNAFAAELRPDGKPRIPAGQHAVKALPDMGGLSGPGNVPGWQLEIKGEVKNPLTLTFSDLSKLKQVVQTCDVHCITGWTLLDSQWSGVPVKTIMELAQVKKNVRFVIFEAHGEYTSSIPVSLCFWQCNLLGHDAITSENKFALIGQFLYTVLYD